MASAGLPSPLGNRSGADDDEEEDKSHAPRATLAASDSLP